MVTKLPYQLVAKFGIEFDYFDPWKQMRSTSIGIRLVWISILRNNASHKFHKMKIGQWEKMIIFSIFFLRKNSYKNTSLWLLSLPDIESRHRTSTGINSCPVMGSLNLMCCRKFSVTNLSPVNEEAHKYKNHASPNTSSDELNISDWHWNPMYIWIGIALWHENLHS